MKSSRLLVVGMVALCACGMTQVATAAPQGTPLASFGFDAHVVATLNSLFGTTTADDSKASDNAAQPSTVHADDPTCEPRTANGQGATSHQQPATDGGHGGGSDSGMLPSTSPRSSGLSWQSLLPGSIQ